MVAALELQRLHVDDRVFPDLRIDEARKEQAEQTFREACEGEGLVLEQGVFQLRIFSAKANVGSDFIHLRRSSS
ncbi:hypothetical protein D3C71_1745220 [compost metagenome]